MIRATDLDRVVFWVDKPLSELADTHVARYIRWGSKQTFTSKKSKAVPVPRRSTCAARPLWYDLTNDKIGLAFWPKAQKYRHIVPSNPESLVCNCNLYTVVPDLNTQHERIALTAILNSTIVGLFKCFYGRYAGSEGLLKTEVVDTVLLEIPDPRGVSEELADRLAKALEKMTMRDVTHLVEDALLQCHSEEAMREILRKPPELAKELCHEDRRDLDDCVFELFGVTDKKKRQILLEELYRETAENYRYQRAQDIQAMEDRSGKKGRRLGAQDLAESIWNSLADTEKSPPIIEWIKSLCSHSEVVEIPEGKAEALGAADMFNPTSVNFKGSKENHLISYSSADQAALVVELASLEVRENVEVPKCASECIACSEQLRDRLRDAENRFAELAASRTGTQSLQEKTSALLMHWYLHGRN